MIAFSGLKPGDKVADFLPNTGDFANELCKVVGDAGHVYVFSMSSTERRGGCSNITAHTLRSRNFPAPELYNASDDPGAVYEYYASRLPVESFVAPEPLDLIWMSGRYHDLHNKSLGSPNILFVTTALLVALKPGGILIIEDHAATETRDAKTLHRITAEQVKKEVVAAGFVFVDESKVLYRADDPHTANAHEMRETDRFVLKFRKPTIGPLS